MGVALSTAEGTSIINESIWESRFQYTEELNKMIDLALKRAREEKDISYSLRLKINSLRFCFEPV